MVQLLGINISYRYIRLLVWIWLLLSPSIAFAVGNNALKSADAVNVKRGQKDYSYEVGAQLGMGYYLGDANSIPFLNMRNVLGAHLRYKFDKRWAVQLKAQAQCIAYTYSPEGQEPLAYQNQIWHADVVGEFNFFKLGSISYDYRVKTFSPYLFLGIGMSVLNKVATKTALGEYKLFLNMNVSTNTGGIKPVAYVPIGVGFKWRIVDRWQLQIVWQHNIYFSDALEGFLPSVDFEPVENEAPSLPKSGVLNNSHELNGSILNIFKNDVVSTLTIGVVYEFGGQQYQRYVHERSAISVRMKKGGYFE